MIYEPVEKYSTVSIEQFLEMQEEIYELFEETS